MNLSGDTQLLRKSVRLETLEPRILLTADTWELNLADLESYDDTFVLRSNLESGNLEVLEAGELLASMLYSEIDAINITGTDNADTFILEVSPSEKQNFLPNGISFIAGAGDDTISNASDLLRWNIISDGTGNLSSTDSGEYLTFSGVKNLTTRGVHNTIDYSEYATGVTINLTEGTASGEMAISGFQHIIGTPYDDVIIGDDQINRIDALGGNDTLTGGIGDDLYIFRDNWGTDVVTEESTTTGTEGLDTYDFTAVTAGVTVTVGVDGTPVVLSGANTATAGAVENILGGQGGNTVDYTLYPTGVVVNLTDGRASLFDTLSGFNTVLGTSEPDILVGTSGDDVIRGQGGNDQISGRGGSDILDGGDGASDVLSVRKDSDLTLSDTTLTVGDDTSTTAGFEQASLTGGISPNTLDASNFTGGGVTMDGGAAVYLDDLNDYQGVDISNAQTSNLSGRESSTPLTSLNNGRGVRVSAGPDFQLALIDGTTFPVNLSSAVTLQDALQLIGDSANANSPGRLRVGLDSSGSSIIIDDLGVGAQGLRITAINNSLAAEDLGILKATAHATLRGSYINASEADLLITLGDGTSIVEVDLSDTETVQDLLSMITGSHDNLTATIASDGRSIIVNDNSPGNGTFTIASANMGNTAADLGIAMTGVNGVITGTPIVNINQSLDGRHDDDHLIGSPSDDSLTGGRGVDSIDGGAGINTLAETGDVDFTLTNSSLTLNATEIDTLISIGKAILIGGESANVIDTTAFSGPATLYGLDGDDTLTSGSEDDLLSGGPGIDQLDGGPGQDTVSEAGDGRLVVLGDTTTATLDMGEGADASFRITLDNSVDGGSFYTEYEGVRTSPIAFDALGHDVKSEMVRSFGIVSSDLRVTPQEDGLGWLISFVGKKAGMPIQNFSAVSNDLTNGNLSFVQVSNGEVVTNQLSAIEKVELIGGEFSDLLDVSEYQGRSILSGGAGDDLLYGGPNVDVISGDAGDDLITGGFANDTLDGGPGADRIFEEGRDSTNISLTNFQLQFDGETDQITGFENATIKTGDSPNTISALDFTGLSSATELTQIYGDLPYRNAAGPRVNLTGIAASTSLASLNSGQGVRSVANPSGTPAENMDFQISLSDSEVFSVDISAATTLQELMNAISMAANTELDEQGRIEVSFTQPHGTSLQLEGSKADDNLSVIALNNSLAAADLGISKDNQGQLLVGSSISDLASDLRIIKTTGDEVNVDLADQLTLDAIFQAINDSDADLSVSLTDDLKAIQVTDSSAGALPLTVIDLNGANIASTLGFTGQAPMGSPDRIVGNEISVATVILDGGGGIDHLIGSPGNDFIFGGTGNDILRGSGGYDTIGAVRDLDMTLRSGTLEFGDGEIDTHESFEAALLTGGAGINRIDTSNFDGPARIDGGGGGDTLLGGAHNDVFGVSSEGLETPGAVQIDVGDGTQNSVVLSGTSSGLTQSLLNLVAIAGAGDRTLVWTGNGDDHLTVDQDIINPVNLEIRAPRSITITGRTIDTSHSTQPGSILLKSELITVDGGSKLLALQTTPHSGGTSSHGNITLQAKFDNALMGFFGVEGANQGFLGFANLDYNRTSITVGTAEIRGGDVELTTHSDTAHFVAIPDYEGAGEFFNSAYDTGLAVLENFSAFAGYSFSESVAHINLGTNDDAAGPTVIRANNFTAHSKGIAGAKSSPLGIAVGVAIARAKTHSVVNLHDVNLQATEDVVIRSSSSQTAFSQADVEGKKGVSAAVAVSIIDSNTIANVSGSSQLTVGGDLFVQADNIDQLTNMARSVSGGDGRVGLAVAIDVEDGTTNAILDGSANVSGNINVTSISDKTGINQSKFFAIFPAEASGVEAAAGTGTNETGDLLKDLQGQAKAKAGNTALAKKAAKKLPKVVTDFLDDRDDSIDPKFQFAAGVAIEIDTNSATSRIGHDAADVSADIEADGTITVSTVVNASPKVVANSSSEWKEGQKTLEAENLSSDELTETDTVKQPDYAVSISLAYGDYQNDANATIAQGSHVDSKNEIQVNAAALSEIDPQSLFGANLVAPFLEDNLAPKFETTSGLQILNFGDTVRVPDNHLSQAEPGVYKYLGPNNASVDLNIEDYSNATNWEGGVTPSTETATAFMTAITSYLTDNLGLNDSTNSWSQATSEGQKKMSMAGSLSFLEMANDARATVNPEAQINQDPNGIEFDGTPGVPDAFRTGQQTLEVTSNTTHHLISIAGQFKPPGIKDFIPTAFGGNKTLETDRVGNSIGATAVIYDVGNTSKATISDNTAIYTDSLKVDADTEVIHALFATSGGEAGDFAFNGVVSHHQVQNETLAQVSDTALITVGDNTIADSPSSQSLWVSANDNTIVINKAGSTANSKKVGLGASAAISNISRDTKALIGAASTTNPYSSAGGITVSGAVAVDAMASGYVGSFGIAGASSKAEETTEREQFMMTDQTQMADGSRTTEQREETVESKKLGNSF